MFTTVTVQAPDVQLHTGLLQIRPHKANLSHGALMTLSCFIPLLKKKFPFLRFSQCEINTLRKTRRCILVQNKMGKRVALWESEPTCKPDAESQPAL